MKHYLHLIILLVLTIFAGSPAARAQNDTPPAGVQPKSSENKSEEKNEIISIDSNLVTVPAMVSDHAGRYVSNLQKEDFQIFENGVEQEIAFFEPVEEPFTVFLLFETSASMGSKMAELAHAGNAFVSQLRPDDRIMAATYSERLKVILKPVNVSNLKKGIKLQQHFGDRYSYIYDAVEDTFKLLAKIPGRKALILFSDGAGAGTYATYKSNLRDAEELDSLIYTVRFNPFPEVPSANADKKYFYQTIATSKKYMQDLALVTGGRNYQIDELNDLEKTFGLIAEELRRQYSLGYYPAQKSQTGERRQITVKVRRPNLAVRARNSYIVGAPTENKSKQ